MSQKHIFIGLGGAGVNTVSQIKYKIYQKQNPKGKKTRLDSMNETYRFLFIDTDARDLESYNRRYADTFEQGRIKFIDPQTDLVSLSKGNPQTIYNEAVANPTPLINQRILEACSPELSARIPDQPLKLGAGAFRMKSRISFARSLSDFQQKLQSHIEALNSVKNSGGEENTIFYWVVCSTNGGTGSGIINDVLYYVNQQHKRSIGDGDPHLVLTMYMPKFYIDKNSTEEKYSLNAFAVFKEIEAFKALSMDERRNKVFHRLAFTKDYNLINSVSRYDPFYYLIPIDCQTDSGANIGDGMYSNTAEMLYYIHDGEGGAALHSDVDNYMHDLYNERPEGFLVPMGYIALRKPDDDFRNYMATRLRFDLLNYGLYNKDCPKIKDEDLEKYLDEAMKSDFDEKIKVLRGKVLEDYLDDSCIRDDEGVVKVDISGDNGFSSSKGDACCADFSQYVNANLNEKKDEYISFINDRLWSNAEKLILEKGLDYTFDLFKRMAIAAKDRLKGIYEKCDVSFDAICNNDGDFKSIKEEAEKYSISERFNKDDQRKQVETYYEKVRQAAETAIDNKAQMFKAQILKEFISEDGESGKICEIKDQLDKLLKAVTDMADSADKKYMKLGNTMNEKGLDVTSVYLPQIKTICDGNGWIKGNIFSYCYELMFKPSQEAVEGKENKPMRNGEKSIQQFLENEVYSPNSNQYKEIQKANMTVKDEVRFLMNQNMLTATASSMIEKFLMFSQRAFEQKVQTAPEIKEKWYDKPIFRFFDELDNADKDRVRSSLRPSLFFNYKENRIAVDYREFLIFVAPDPELATVMLGYQPGNNMHRFIPSADTNAAFVIRAKYGLSFSDYRLYDTLKERYDKAPFREKYHFHRYFAEYGSNILLEDLPYEVSPAHRVFTKLSFLQKFTPFLKGFFYESNYMSQKADYTDKPIIDKPNGSFAIVRAKAIREFENKVCIQVKDKNTRLAAEYEGNNFFESFSTFQKDFMSNSVEDTYEKYLMEIMRHKELSAQYDNEGNTVVDNEGNPVLAEMSGETIIAAHFDDIRTKMLEELDRKAFESVKEAEKSVYTVMFEVLDKELKSVKNL